MTVVALLREGCRREREQTLFYRGLTGQAEDAGDRTAAERLNELLADEQHHVSRLTARLLELGERPSREDVTTPECPLEEWEETARSREAEEVAWYQAALDDVDDAQTAAVLREILESERKHLQALAGKWMSAAAPTREPKDP